MGQHIIKQNKTKQTFLYTNNTWKPTLKIQAIKIK